MRGVRKMFSKSNLGPRYNAALINGEALAEENAGLKYEVEVLNALVDSYQGEIAKHASIIAEMKVRNRALKDALKIATEESEVEHWKTALDRDIDQYILKEGGDEKEEEKCS